MKGVARTSRERYSADQQKGRDHGPALLRRPSGGPREARISRERLLG